MRQYPLPLLSILVSPCRHHFRISPFKALPEASLYAFRKACEEISEPLVGDLGNDFRQRWRSTPLRFAGLRTVAAIQRLFRRRRGAGRWVVARGEVGGWKVCMGEHFTSGRA